MNKQYLYLFLAFVAAGAGVAWLMRSRSSQGGEGRYARTTISELPEAQASQTVELQHGDSYDLTAEFVRKKIGEREHRMLAYNGSIPGPLIKVKQGSEVTINFTNNTDVDSTIHSHGVRVENAFDGTPDLTQKPVKPGESFIYKLKFPDAGVYWYHPHIREDYAQELGLYGNFIVEPDDPGYWTRTVNREEVLMLDDILIENGSIVRFDPDSTNHTLMGRFGNVMLVNGETGYRLDIKQGEIVRFYLTNAANTRTFNISMSGVRMKLVGGDNGKYERESFANSVVLGPSERAVIEVYFNTTDTHTLEHRTPEKTYHLATFRVGPDRVDAPYTNAFVLRENEDIISSIDSYRSLFSLPVDKSLRLAVAMKSPMGMLSGNGQHMMHGGMMMDNAMMRMGNAQPIEWEDDMGAMNRDSTTKTLEWQMIDESTGKANMKIDGWKFKMGDKVKVKIFNDPKTMPASPNASQGGHPMQHPVHIHGQRFLVISTNGVKNDNLVWKDTALVKTGDTAELLVDMSNPGTWMIHCHIAEHLEAGMMTKFEVI